MSADAKNAKPQTNPSFAALRGAERREARKSGTGAKKAVAAWPSNGANAPRSSSPPPIIARYGASARSRAAARPCPFVRSMDRILPQSGTRRHGAALAARQDGVVVSST